MSKAAKAINCDVFKPRGWGAGFRAIPLPRPWHGLDTERDALTGEFVCGWIVGDCETHRFKRMDGLQPGTYWVYNLAYDIEGMLRDLDQKNGFAARIDGSTFPLLDGHAVYFHGKRFEFTNDTGRRLFLDAASFNGRRPLTTLGAKDSVNPSTMSLSLYLADAEYAREHKVKDSDGKIAWIPTGEIGRYRTDVDKYCINDAKIVYDYVSSLETQLSAMGILLGGTPGATARRFMARLPKLPDVIWQTHMGFLRSYCGGRFEICKRGVLHNAKQYDMVSAYPWALSNCPWLTPSAYSRATTRFSDTALYGSYCVSFNTNSEYLGVAPVWKKGVRIYSAEQANCWLTRPEVEWLLGSGVDVKIHRGIEIWDENALPLWKDVITELFELKRAGKHGWGPKIILNSQYGILIQLNTLNGSWVPLGTALNPIDWCGFLELEAPREGMEAGQYYAPVYAATLTAMVRMKIVETVSTLDITNYIGSHTDSVLTTCKLPRLGSNLGDWQLEEEALKANICKTGMYSIGSKVKIRGITRDGNPSMLWDDTLWRKKRIGIKSAADWSEVSLIVPTEVLNNFAIETKRDWEGPVTRGLLAFEKHVDSKPWRNVR